MDTLKEICQKDGRNREVINMSSLVKHAVILLGGRRWNREEEEKKGGMDMEWSEMKVEEKIL